MVKDRLIFTLLHNHGTFVLSRNFRLQQVGNLDWLKKHYNFESIAFSIDELIVLNVARDNKDIAQFAANLRELSRLCLMPIAAGGGIRSVEDARTILNSGADTLVVNTPLVDRPELIADLVSMFGSQSIVASVDYTRKGGAEDVMIENGSRSTGWSVAHAVENAQDLGAGEMYITSMDKDGTGQGLDLPVMRMASGISRLPVIASGGIGNYAQVAEGLLQSGVKAVSTANLFNFLGRGLEETRKHLIEQGRNMALWAMNWEGLTEW